MAVYDGGILSYGNDGETPGVRRLLIPQSTDAAAEEALKEQKHGDEFKQQPSPDINALVARLNELELEKSRICVKLYGPMDWYEQHGEPYKGPPYLQREVLNYQLAGLDQECWAIKSQLRELIAAFVEDPTDDYGGLNEGPYTGNARVIASD